MITVVEALGGSGALISMISNIPQVWKVRHPGTTADLHVCTIILHCISAALWSAYGFLLQLYILGIESGIVTLLNLCILLAIYRDSRSDPGPRSVKSGEVFNF